MSFEIGLQVRPRFIAVQRRTGNAVEDARDVIDIVRMRP
ncbi:MAG: hypothetical protein CM15mP18_1240 [Methanobacteriota archaeon]|nr:MAG: hypothetical protein CM15mP18_1240 [Euryarchaeota archaeon]